MSYVYFNFATISSRHPGITFVKMFFLQVCADGEREAAGIPRQRNCPGVHGLLPHTHGLPVHLCHPSGRYPWEGPAHEAMKYNVLFFCLHFTELFFSKKYGLLA